MVNNIQRRGIFQSLHLLHEPEQVAGIVEIPCPDILNLHHHGIQFPDAVHRKHNMVRARRQFSVARRKDFREIASLAENFIHISAMIRTPAVLGAETSHPPLCKGLVQLVLQWRCPERKHLCQFICAGYLDIILSAMALISEASLSADSAVEDSAYILMIGSVLDFLR